jgi:hypothetical protein
MRSIAGCFLRRFGYLKIRDHSDESTGFISDDEPLEEQKNEDGIK